MKLRLQIATGDNGSTTLEHGGPLIRIGRDPECELSLQGETGRAVSRIHAQIELTPAGAILTDAGSSNGTLLNDSLIKKPRQVRPGDRIQLGHTGATLQVLEIELPSAPAPVSRPVPVPLLLAGAGVLLVGLLVLTVVLWRGSRTRPPRDAGLAQGADPAGPVVPSAPVNPIPPEGNQRTSPNPSNPGTNPPEQPKVPEPIPSEVRPVGRYVSLPRWGPSVLLQRPGDSYPWTVLRPEGAVLSSQTLVSLPGYRSLVALGREGARGQGGSARGAWTESGVHLGLWGNLPEFAGFPPVLESVVMINLPAADVDLDLILERGRIHLANHKAGAAVRVRLRFLREVWDLTLPSDKSEVCAELWALPSPLTPDARRQVLCLGLFTKGQVKLKTPLQELDLPGPARVSWVSGGNGQLQRETLSQLPDWWTRPAGPASPQAADVMLSLLDWQKTLLASNEILDKILTEIRESKDPTYRVVGLLFLSALGGQQYLVDFLEDRQHSEVRGTASHALRSWLGANSGSAAELARLIQEKRGYSKEKALLIVELLQPLPPSALARPETYQRLIDSLKHENLAVRDLAFWHLVHRVPQGAQSIKYDPVGPVEEQQQGMEQWRKLIPSGTIPGK